LKLKFKPKTSFIFLIIGTFVVGGIAVGSNEVDGVLFSLAGTGTEVPDVDCWGKTQSTFGVDDNDNPIVLENSSFLSAPPLFDFITIGGETPTSADVITHFLKQRCTFPTGNSDNTDLPLVVKAGSAFKVSVYAYEEGVDNKELVFTQTKTVPSDVELLWNTESILMDFDIPLKNIIDGLKVGEYEATAEIVVEGTARMNYKGIQTHSSSNWQFEYEATDVRTWIDFPIKKTSTATVKVVTGGTGSGSDSQVFDKNNLGSKNINDKSNDDLTEFIECAKIMNTECMFHEKYNSLWMVIGVGVVGMAYMERSRQ
jgi:hypothetical protein